MRNDGGNKNNWIMIKCIGTRSNRSAIGTRVKVTSGGRSQIDEVMSGSSYYSQNDFRLHFGLGQATKADSVDLTWPSGVKESFQNAARESPVRPAGNEGNHRHQEISLGEIPSGDEPAMRRHRHVLRLDRGVFFFFCSGGATPAPDVQFADTTQASRIDFKHENSATSNKYLIETMGGGVALF